MVCGPFQGHQAHVGFTAHVLLHVCMCQKIDIVFYHTVLLKHGACTQVLPTQLIPDEKEGKVLRVRMIQKEGVKFFNPAYLFDEGSTISWIPCGRKLTCSFPGIKFYYGPDTYFGEEVRLSACLLQGGHLITKHY